MDRNDAGDRVFKGSLEVLRPTWEQVDTVFTELGLDRDVKTIYVSYTDQSRNLVAAVHPDPVTSTIEVALSLPADDESDLTYDATHLKWRTLPLAIRLGPNDELTERIVELFDRAIEHAPASVARPSHDFEKVRRRGRHQA